VHEAIDERVAVERHHQPVRHQPPFADLLLPHVQGQPLQFLRAQPPAVAHLLAARSPGEPHDRSDVPLGRVRGEREQAHHSQDRDYDDRASRDL
jgi:hypothetical protein